MTWIEVTEKGKLFIYFEMRNLFRMTLVRLDVTKKRGD